MVPKMKEDRDWPAINEAYIHEKEHVLRYAHELCRGIVEPVQPCGRPRVPRRDVVFGALLWVYGVKSSRDAMFDFKMCQERELISRRLHFASMLRHLQDPTLTPLLRALLRESALPMRHIERFFAVDATGFSTHVWHKGGARKEKIWLKAHAICGTDTKIVTDCVIADEGAEGCVSEPNFVAEAQICLKSSEEDPYELLRAGGNSSGH